MPPGHNKAFECLYAICLGMMAVCGCIFMLSDSEAGILVTSPCPLLSCRLWCKRFGAHAALPSALLSGQTGTAWPRSQSLALPLSSKASPSARPGGHTAHMRSYMWLFFSFTVRVVSADHVVMFVTLNVLVVKHMKNCLAASSWLRNVSKIKNSMIKKQLYT